MKTLAERALGQIISDGEQETDRGKEVFVVIMEEEELRLEETAEKGVAIQARLGISVDRIVVILMYDVYTSI